MTYNCSLMKLIVQLCLFLIALYSSILVHLHETETYSEPCQTSEMELFVKINTPFFIRILFIRITRLKIVKKLRIS